MRKHLLPIIGAFGIAAGTLGLITAQPAQAAVYNPTCSVASLRTVLASAALVPGPHVVTLPANCVYSFSNTAPTNPDSALPAITRNVVILGNGSTFERAPGAPSMRFLEVRGGGTLTVRNLTMRGGDNPASDGLVTDPNYAGQSNGGAVRCTDAGLVMDLVTLEQNEAANGAAVYAEDCDVLMTDSTAVGNVASNDGGALLITRVDDPDVFLTVRRSDLSENVAQLDGGAIVANVDRVTVNKTTFIANSAVLGNGGAVHLTTNDEPSDGISFSTLSYNNAGGDGGALWMAPNTNGSVGIEFSTLNGNTATNGGAVVMAYGGIHRSTLSGNVALAAGGALYTNWATVGLDRVTVADNLSNVGTGNAIAGSGMIYPTNSLIAYRGVAFSGTLCDETAGLSLYPASVGSLSEGECLGFTTIAGGAADIQPLADNGGRTLTHTLGATSAALDAGDQATCDATAWMGDHDQRGLPYVLTSGAACDVGSVEVQ